MTNRIRELRTANHLTQAELAKLMDISPSLVARHEDDSRNITGSDIDKYCAIFKCTPKDLFTKSKKAELDYSL